MDGERGLGGVYTSMPSELPATLRGCDVVVAGDSTDAVLRLADCCRSVTFVTARSARIPELRGRTNVTILAATEIVCIDGIGQVESVVVRKVRTGAVSACSTAALFLLSESKGEPS